MRQTADILLPIFLSIVPSSLNNFIVLITGICGFVGSELSKALLAQSPAIEISGIDNFSRNGSWLNRDRLAAKGIKVIHGDIRNPSDLETLGSFDWVIDAAANPSVLAGVDGKSSSRQLIANNLRGAINLLEACKQWKAGFILLSPSQLYSIKALYCAQGRSPRASFSPVTGDPITRNHTWPQLCRY